MRTITAEEKTKRGCFWCADVASGKVRGDKRKRKLCPYTTCPYTVLDKYDTYEDYMKSKDSKINIAAFVEAVGGAGRVTESARVNIPVLRRLGKEPLF